MTEKNRNIYKRLVKAYYKNNDFEQQVNNILKTEFTDEEEGMNLLLSLCGVSRNNKTDNFIYDLAKAITNNEVRNDIINKVSKCKDLCSKSNENCLSICPFDAILNDDLLKDKIIDTSLCFNCGKCVDLCKNDIFIDSHDGLLVLESLKKKQKVIACVAPAIAGQFGNDVSMDQLRTALVKIGFADMIEVSFAADILTIIEAIEFNRHIDTKEDLMITSCCCPLWISMIRKNYHDFIKYTTPTVSPMIACGRIIKKLNPECITVFIGPCIAKKKEAREDGINDAINYVLTFEELDDIFTALEIKPNLLPETPSIIYAGRGGKLYPVSGGICESIEDMVQELYPEKQILFKSVNVSGVKECKECLEKIKNKNVTETFVEGLGCSGGCVNGPKVIVEQEKGKKRCLEEAYSSKVKVSVHSLVVDEIMDKIGLKTIDDFLNHDKTKLFHRNL